MAHARTPHLCDEDIVLRRICHYITSHTIHIQEILMLLLATKCVACTEAHNVKPSGDEDHLRQDLHVILLYVN